MNKNIKCQDRNNERGQCLAQKLKYGEINHNKHSEHSETSTFQPRFLQEGSRIIDMYTGYSHRWRTVALVRGVF